MAAVRDDRGNLYQVSCRVSPGGAALAKGEKVLLVGYDERDNTFDVVPDDGGVLARQRRKPVTAATRVTGHSRAAE
jgi:hypothetical protein